LYPPVYVTLREALEDDQLGDYDINAGTTLVVNIRGTHLSTRYWENPHIFDPDRFSPERSATRHKSAFLPFISGPRKCMGDSFAMMEMALVVPTILQQVNFADATTPQPKPDGGFVLEPAGGYVPATVEKRLS